MHRGYWHIDRLGYQHYTVYLLFRLTEVKLFRIYHFKVNHRDNFVDRVDTNIHTNHIEAVWRPARKYVPGSGCRPEVSGEYMAMFCFIHECTHSGEQRFRAMLRVLGDLTFPLVDFVDQDWQDAKNRAEARAAALNVQ